MSIAWMRVQNEDILEQSLHIELHIEKLKEFHSELSYVHHPDLPLIFDYTCPVAPLSV